MEKQLNNQTIKKNAREFQILHLITESYFGLTKKELKNEIGCDYRTITTYISRLLKDGKIKVDKSEKRDQSKIYIKA